MTHRCHAIGCDTEVAPVLFMCRDHWNKVPAYLKRLIWALYRAGQCNDWRPSVEYCIVAKNAVIAVAQIERRIVRFDELEVALYDRLVSDITKAGQGS